jgi:hypothetical protein
MKHTFTPWSYVAGVILVIMAVIMVYLARTDSLTTDEKAHLPAGVAYVGAQNGNFNPEHPPLMKILAGVSVKSLVNPVIPHNDTSWRGANQQLEFADALFLANPDDRREITFLGRLPFIMVTLGFASLLYWWISRRYGQPLGILSLIIFGFSPTVLSHGHLVTFDVAAGFGLFIALISFGAWLQKPIWQRAVLAGLCLASALLIKFSALALVPIFFIGAIGWWLLQKEFRNRSSVASFALLLVVSTVAVLGTYRYITWNYEPTKNKADFLVLTKDYGQRPIIDATANLIGHRFTQPLGHYAGGTILTLRRSRYGSVSYLLGEVKKNGDHRYFPVLFLTKETIPTLLLYVGTGMFALYSAYIALGRRKSLDWRAWTTENYTQLLIAGTAFLYAALAIKSPLNIGYRHILPAVLLLIPLTAHLLSRLLAQIKNKGQLRYVTILLALLALWNIAEVVKQPFELLNYYNQFAGGADRGYDVAVDSNYDWGQDLYRLQQYMNNNYIGDISLEYFGGDPPEFYLGERYQHWQSNFGQPEGWFGVSATIRQNAMGKHASDVPGAPVDSYEWLQGVEPTARVGSIFLYEFK